MVFNSDDLPSPPPQHVTPCLAPTPSQLSAPTQLLQALHPPSLAGGFRLPAVRVWLQHGARLLLLVAQEEGVAQPGSQEQEVVRYHAHLKTREMLGLNFHGEMVFNVRGSMVFNVRGSMVFSFHGPTVFSIMDQQSSMLMGQWSSAFMDQWSSMFMGQWSSVFMDQWSSMFMGQWSSAFMGQLIPIEMS